MISNPVIEFQLEKANKESAGQPSEGNSELTLVYDPYSYHLFKDKASAQEFSNQFALEKKKIAQPTKQGSVLAGALKKQWDRESKGLDTTSPLEPGLKKWKKMPAIPRKSAHQAKIEATEEEFQTIEEMQEKLKELDREIDEAVKGHGQRLAEKTETLQTNIKYYGSRVQTLIQEIVSRQPYDQETGRSNTLGHTVKKLGIDAEKIKFDFQSEDFTDF